VFGADHAQIGGLVAGRWNLPEPLVEAITYHHDLTTDQTPIGAAVALAHSLIPAVINAGSPDSLPLRTASAPGTETLAGVLQVLQISPLAMPQLLEAAQQRYEVLEARYAS